jgi:hypothetical protein
VTVPNLGLHTAFVDGSRLCWALPSLVHEGLGYRATEPDRIQGDAVLPHALFVAQSRITSYRSSRPIVPTLQPRAVLGAVKAWPGPAWASRTHKATASLDGAGARRNGMIVVGMKKRARSNKETGGRKALSLTKYPNPTIPRAEPGAWGHAYRLTSRAPYKVGSSSS